MSEWKEVPEFRGDDGDGRWLYSRERWLLVVEYKPDGSPAVWVSAMHRVTFWVTFWEMELATPRDGDEVDTMKVFGPDRRNECVGKTREELVKMFESWGAA